MRKRHSGLLLLSVFLGATALLVVVSQLGGFRGLWAKSTGSADDVLPPSDKRSEIVLVPVAGGFTQPLALEFVPGGQGRAIVLEKGGMARLLDLSSAENDSPTVAQPSATVLKMGVRTQSEMGLLGIALHPDYEKNGRLFLNYNPKEGHQRTVIAEWQLPLSDLGKRPARFVREVLSVEQPFPNHDGGHLAFGPDGYLYIGLGDGGSANDPRGNGQNLNTLLGAMLRIDVNGAAPYAIPADNPFKNQQGARPEIWAYGLRNPWRYSFAPSGLLVVGDVGQNSYEEIDVVTRGANMGWNIREAKHCFEPKQGCRTSGLVDPIFEYGRDLGASVTGGVTYTGKRIPSLSGAYVFGDFVHGNLWSLEVSAHGKSAVNVRRLGKWPINPVAFGKTPKGEIIVLAFNTGTLYRLDSRPKRESTN